MPPKPFKIVILSDISLGADKLQDGQSKTLSSRAASLLRYQVTRINNEIRPAFVIQLGNVIEDEDEEEDEDNYSKCVDILKQLSMPVYHVVGDKEQVNLDLAKISSILKYPKLYYSFDSASFHFVVLFSTSKDHSEIHIDAIQREWLEKDLHTSDKQTIVFVHHPIHEQDLNGIFGFDQNPESCLVEERAELREILARSGKVRAVFSGNVHRNNLQCHDNIYYVTLQSMVENMSKTGKTASESIAIVTISEDEIRVEIEGLDPAEYRLSANK